MAPWFTQFRTFMRIFFALLSMVFPLWGLLLASGMLYRLMQSPPNDVYYVKYDFGDDIVWWVVLSLCGILAAGRVLFVRHARLHWLWFPFAMLFLLIFVPNQFHHHVHHPLFPSFEEPWRSLRVSRSAVSRELSSLYYDMKPAIERGDMPPCVSGPTDRVSPYHRAGVPLVYQQVCVTTDVPLDSLLASSAPGTLYIMRRPGDPTIRLRATVLGTNQTTTISWAPAFYGTDPLELTISTPPEPTPSPLVQEEAPPMSSGEALPVLQTELTPHANH
ncbi:MAG: hypothetical protein OEY86_02335 [Nitrospira sp.]|nr:hypothetical protein [Nitrospira sp.]